SRSPLASSVSPNQPNRSRNGLSARVAPSRTRATTFLVVVWTDLSGPPEDSPKYAVRSTRQHTTSANKTARRRRTCLSYMTGETPTDPGREATGETGSGEGPSNSLAAHGRTAEVSALDGGPEVAAHIGVLRRVVPV